MWRGEMQRKVEYKDSERNKGIDSRGNKVKPRLWAFAILHNMKIA